MNMLNQVILEGNIANEVELIENTENTTVAKVVISYNRIVKGMDGETENEVSYFDIQAFGKLAENLIKYGYKGRGIRVVGRFKQSKYEYEGSTFSKVYIAAEYIEYKPYFMNNKEE